MTPGKANFAGNVHGGHPLEWLDQGPRCNHRPESQLTSRQS